MKGEDVQRKKDKTSKTSHFKWPQPSTTHTKQVHWAKSAEIPFYKRLQGLWSLKKEVSRKKSRTGVKLRQTCFLILLLLFLIIGSWWQGSWCGASLIINIFTILHACKVESTNTRVNQQERWEIKFDIALKVRRNSDIPKSIPACILILANVLSKLEPLENLCKAV